MSTGACAFVCHVILTEGDWDFFAIVPFTSICAASFSGTFVSTTASIIPQEFSVLVLCTEAGASCCTEDTAEALSPWVSTGVFEQALKIYIRIKNKIRFIKN